MNLITYPDSEMMMMDLANVLAGELERALIGEDRATLAVTGGETPGPMFDTLCAADLEWVRVDVMLTDERWVPETSERSNTRLVKERLLVNRAAAANYLPLYAPIEEPEHALEGLERAIAPKLPISVLILGMGADMHTASLFPGSDDLAAALHGERILYAARAEGIPEPRVTLSARVLNGAIAKHLVIVGNNKLKALERAKTLPPEEAPIAAFLSGLTVHWAES